METVTTQEALVKAADVMTPSAIGWLAMLGCGVIFIGMVVWLTRNGKAQKQVMAKAETEEGKVNAQAANVIENQTAEQKWEEGAAKVQDAKKEFLAENEAEKK